jgi:quercetin dioxygenase-like cupin family protein
MNFENYKLEQGSIMIAFSDEKLSVGTLELNSGAQLSRHDRPCLESLFQLKGKCVIKFDDREVELNEGEQIDISVGTFHIHSNPFSEKSLTFWKASGDITEIIRKIREGSKM